MDERTRETAEDLVDLLRPLDTQVRAMFGGYCLYLDGKVVGLVCDGRVFVKRSTAEDPLGPIADLAPAYPGARDSWRLAPDALPSHADLLQSVVRATADALPASRRR